MTTSTNYRKFLSETLAPHLREGRSLRWLSRQFGFKSPNFLSLVLTGKRNLSLASATQLARAMELTAREQQYFLALVEETVARDPKIKAQLASRSKEREGCLKIRRINRPAHYSTWLNGLICEMTLLKDFHVSADSLSKMLKGVADAQSVGDSFSKLRQSKTLVPCERKGWKKSFETFESPNDKRSILLQEIHRRYLGLAQRRLQADIAEREYQGLTIAVEKSRITDLKARIRDFIDALDDEFTITDGAETVFHVEIAGFQVFMEDRGGQSFS